MIPNGMTPLQAVLVTVAVLAIVVLPVAIPAFKMSRWSGYITTAFIIVVFAQIVSPFLPWEYVVVGSFVVGYLASYSIYRSLLRQSMARMANDCVSISAMAYHEGLKAGLGADPDEAVEIQEVIDRVDERLAQIREVHSA